MPPMLDTGGLYSHRGTRAIERMVEFAPSTGGLALWVRHHDVPADERAPLIATDGDVIYYGEKFERLALAQQTGLVAHEVLHVALRHPQRLEELRVLLGDVDLELFNICADAIVNSALSHLTWLELPSSTVFLDQLLSIALSERASIEKALLEWNVERLYRAIDDRRVGPRSVGRKNRHESGNRGGGGEAGSGRPDERASAEDEREGAREDGPRAAQVRSLGGGMPADLKEGRDRSSAPEASAEEARVWSERLLRGHAGDGAHSMLRALLADVPRSRTPWEHALRTQLAHSLAPQPGISWSRPSRSYIANQGRAGPHRRMPWTPGFSSSKAVPHLVVIVDVSGSIDEPLMQRFAREIESITRRQEAGLVLVIGDDRVQRVVHFEPGRSDLRDIKFTGGGGTDFSPLLEEAERHRPDIVVVLTDLDGPARYRPRWPVIWAVPAQHESAVAPFGRKLILF